MRTSWKIKIAIIGIIFFVSFSGVSVLAQGEASSIDLKTVFPTIVLKNGEILHHVRIFSFGSSTIMAKWDGGSGTIAYDALPEEMRKAAKLRKPAPSTADDQHAANEKISALVAARRGFSTHLLRREVDGGPPDQPLMTSSPS